MCDRDVGEVRHLRVWHDGSGPSAAWHLALIELTRAASGGANAGTSGSGSGSGAAGIQSPEGEEEQQQPLYFVCGDWLAPPSCERVLTPSRTDPRAGMVSK